MPLNDMAVSTEIRTGDIESRKGEGEHILANTADDAADDVVSSSASSNNNLLLDANQQPAPSFVLESEAQILREAKIIGGQYTRHEFEFVLTVGVVLSFNAGYVNGACLSGLLTPNGVQQSVAGFTSAYTIAALGLADGNIDVFGRQSCMILSFILGSCISGAMTPNARPHRLEPNYGSTFLIGGTFLIVASVLAAVDEEEYFFYFAAAANGIQNGMSSLC